MEIVEFFETLKNIRQTIQVQPTITIQPHITIQPQSYMKTYKFVSWKFIYDDLTIIAKEFPVVPSHYKLFSITK